MWNNGLSRYAHRYAQLRKFRLCCLKTIILREQSYRNKKFPKVKVATEVHRSGEIQQLIGNNANMELNMYQLVQALKGITDSS